MKDQLPLLALWESLRDDGAAVGVPPTGANIGVSGTPVFAAGHIYFAYDESRVRHYAFKYEAGDVFIATLDPADPTCFELALRIVEQEGSDK